MGLALWAALTSPDPSTQNAAYLADTDGSVYYETVAVNRFPDNVVNNDERWKRPTKYFYVEHAERNSIYAAARSGICTEGLTMVAVWASCADCARAIIQAGIIHLIRYYSEDDHAHWSESNAIGDQMMLEAGVRITTLTQPIIGARPLLRNGKQWFLDGVTTPC